MASAITLVAAGDVEWSGATFDYQRWSQESMFNDPGETSLSEEDWLPIPRVMSAEAKAALARRAPTPSALPRDCQVQAAARRRGCPELGPGKD